MLRRKIAAVSGASGAKPKSDQKRKTPGFREGVWARLLFVEAPWWATYCFTKHHGTEGCLLGTPMEGKCWSPKSKFEFVLKNN